VGALKCYDVRAILRRFEIEVTWEEGTRLWARCPFHPKVLGREDAHPGSWFIRRDGPRAGQSHCFSCESGGALPWLVMHLIGLQEWGSAVDWLDEFRAEDEPLPRGVEVRVVARGSGRAQFAMPEGVVDDEPLHLWPSAPREYAESRGLAESQVRRWSVGYALDGRLGGRLVVPVHDYADELANYMARSMGPSRRRYLYPSLAEGPDLDAVFGERHWPMRRERVYACEGALNAMAVERAVPGAHVAALGGSHIRPLHAAKLSTFGEVFLLTDPDEAGERAANSLRASLGRHCWVTRVTLPEGRDPNDLSPEELRTCVDAAGRSSSDSRGAT